MVMKKTFLVSMMLAVLLLSSSYNTESSLRSVSGVGHAALEVTGLPVVPSDSAAFAVGSLIEYAIVVGAFYFFLRSVARSFGG
jgi:hypothetical protein